MAISQGKYSFDMAESKKISSEAMGFVQGLLQKESKNKVAADKALSHPWISGCIDINSKDAKGVVG